MISEVRSLIGQWLAKSGLWLVTMRSIRLYNSLKQFLFSRSPGQVWFNSQQFIHSFHLLYLAIHLCISLFIFTFNQFSVDYICFSVIFCFNLFYFSIMKLIYRDCFRVIWVHDLCFVHFFPCLFWFLKWLPSVVRRNTASICCSIFIFYFVPGAQYQWTVIISKLVGLRSLVLDVMVSLSFWLITLLWIHC